MKTKHYLAALICASAALSGTAHADVTWNWEVSGLITSGVDNLGLFGVKGADLTGHYFYKTFHADLTSYSEAESHSPGSYMNLHGIISEPYTVTVRVNGIEKSFTPMYSQPAWTSDAQQEISWGSGGINAIESDERGYVPSSFLLFASYDSAVATSLKDHFVPVTYPDPQEWLQTIHAEWGLENVSSRFELYDNSLNAGLSTGTYFTSTAVQIDVNGTPLDSLPGYWQNKGSASSIPEPASLALFGGGVLVLVAQRRRASAKAA